MNIKSIKIFYKAPVLFALILYLSVSFAVGSKNNRIAVTEVKIRHNQKNEPYLTAVADITFNNAIKIKKIQAYEVGGRFFLKLPEYVSKSGNVYPQVILLTKESNELVKEAIRGQSPSAPGEAGELEYKITGIKLYSDFSSDGKKAASNLKAFAKVSFNDSIEIESRILDGRFGLWVAWPSEKSEKGDKWADRVLFLDKKLKDSVEKELLERYKEYSNTSGKKSN
ncbi:MAG: septation protein SpoVG family protein [Endomicrobiales bacterium]|nr:septation protein SpoVG family protein [Endomicrobiales bacterium]